MTQRNLLVDRRFWPLFGVQFLGAFNDNLFKNALVVLIAFGAMDNTLLTPPQWVAVCGGLFILPFFLFSVLAGQLADRFPKPTLIRWVKAAELVIMLMAAAGFLLHSLPVLLTALFLMGAQSAFFGPLKFGILPQLLGEDELVGGNALVGVGTFLAILLGTIGAGWLMGADAHGVGAVGIAVTAVATVGILSSCFLRPLPAQAPGLPIRLGFVRPAWAMGRLLWKNRTVRLSALGAAWFWFYAAAVLSLLPGLCKDTLGGDARLFTLFLAIFAIGIGIGALLCQRLSRQRVELGLVPLGSIGLTVFTVDLYLATRHATPTGEALGPLAYLLRAGSWRVVLDLLLLSITAGLYIVPLQTLIQQRSADSERSRVIAAGNMLNALFMVAAAGLLVAVQAFNWTPPALFAAIAALNLGVAVYIYTVVPEFLYRFLAWAVTVTLYRVRVDGADRIPREGPAVLVCNHVSFVDWLLVAAACRRPVRFVMYHKFWHLPVVRRVFRRAKVIPIAPLTESRQLLLQSFEKIGEALEAGELVCIFPEGRLTNNGEICPFQRGIERILKRNPVPVVPMAIQGMWGSFFSRRHGRAFRGPIRPLRAIGLRIGEPVPPMLATAQGLRGFVSHLRGDVR